LRVCQDAADAMDKPSVMTGSADHPADSRSPPILRQIPIRISRSRPPLLDAAGQSMPTGWRSQPNVDRAVDWSERYSAIDAQSGAPPLARLAGRGLRGSAADALRWPARVGWSRTRIRAAPCSSAKGEACRAASRDFRNSFPRRRPYRSGRLGAAASLALWPDAGSLCEGARVVVRRNDSHPAIALVYDSQIVSIVRVAQ